MTEHVIFKWLYAQKNRTSHEASNSSQCGEEDERSLNRIHENSISIYE